MVIGFTTTCTYAISAYHHQRCEFESCSGEVYSIQHYGIKFVSDLCRVSGFRTPVSSINKTDYNDITEILLKVALNTINLPPPHPLVSHHYYITICLIIYN